MAKEYGYKHLVQYYETDQMAVVHHSNYIRWFEEARVRFFEEIGLGYKHMEEIGIISPVVSVTAQFKTMTKFYDTVVIGLKISKYTGVRLEFEYEVKDEVTGEVRATGKSEHCFINPEGRLISLKKDFPEQHERLTEIIQEG